MKSEFARGYSDTNFFSEKIFYVNNCGYYVDIDIDLKVARPEGREDYQLIYVKSGCIEVHFKDRIERVTEGNILIFLPKEPQKYFVLKQEKTSFCWIHFSGSMCEKLVSQLKIEGNIIKIGTVTEIWESCVKITNEIKYGDNEVYVNAIAVSVIALARKRNSVSKIDLIAERMQSDIENKRDYSSYHEYVGMSEFHFIRLFKGKFGVTPLAYFTRLKMEKAKFLLTETSLKIKDISDELGYSDPFYFSNVFKKHTGVSPAKYRKQG